MQVLALFLRRLFLLYSNGVRVRVGVMADAGHLPRDFNARLAGANYKPVVGDFSPGGQYWAICEKPGLFRRHSGKPTLLTTTPIDCLTPVPGREPGTLYVLGRLHRGELVRWNRASGEFVPYLSGVSAHWATSSRDGRWVTYVTYRMGSCGDPRPTAARRFS